MPRIPQIKSYGRGYSFRYTDESGRQHRVTRATLEEAQTARERIYDQKRRGKSTAPVGMTFQQAAERWRRTKRKARYSTMETWDGIVKNHLVPAFGPYLCQDIAENAEEYLGAYIDGKLGEVPETPPIREGSKAKSRLSLQSVHHHLTILGQIFAWVEKHTKGQIRNPVPDLDVPSIDDFEPVPLEPSEVRELISLTDEEFKAHIWVLVSLGPRISELLALKYSDWDPDAFPETGEGTLWIGRQLRRRRRKTDKDLKPLPGELAVEEAAPKTKRGSYEYRISAHLNEVLRRHQALTATWSNPKQLIFGNSVGGYDTPSNFRNRVFLPAVLALTIKHLDKPEIAALRKELGSWRALLVDLLALPHTTLQILQRLSWQNYSDGQLSFVDADGRQQVVPVPRPVRQQLQRHQAAQEDDGLPNKASLILRGDNQRSKPFPLQATAQTVKEALDRLELMPAITPHRMRTTYVSALIAARVDPERVSVRARHARTETTYRRYTRAFRHQHLVEAADTAGLYSDASQ